MLPLMDWLEKEKKVLKDQEGISRLGQLLKISYLSILLLCDPFERILPDDETLDLYLKKKPPNKYVMVLWSTYVIQNK